MSEEQENLELIEPIQTGSSKKVILVAGGLFLISNLVWGGVMFMQPDKAQAAQQEGAKKPGKLTEEELAQMDKEQEFKKPGPLLELKPFIVNLDETQGTHYLRVTMKMELGSEEGKPHVEENLVKIRDRFLSILSSKRMTELRSQEDKEALRAQLLNAAQRETSKRLIQGIYFSEFLTQ